MKQTLPQKAVSILCMLLLSFFALQNINAQTAFTSGNLVVVNVNSSNVVSVLEYTTGGTLVQTISIPSTGATTALTISSSGSSEGALARSSNGQYLGFAGYRTGTNGSGTDRVIARVNPDGTVSTATAIPNSEGFGANNIRGAIFSDDGNTYWAVGAGTGGGIRKGTFAATSGSTQISTTITNIRTVHIFNGQLYIASNQSNFSGICKVGTGLLTTSGQTISLLSGFPTGSGPSPFAFAINSAGTVAYVADDRATTAGGIQKWTLSGGAWSLAGTFNPATGVLFRGLTVDWSGTNPVIYATTTEATTNKIVKFTDDGSSYTPTLTTIATAAANNVFKGVAFAPVTASTLPVVNLSVSTNSASEAGATAVTVTATASAAVTGDQTVNLAVSGTGITSGDYTLSNSTITIPNGSTTGSVTFTVVDDAAIEGTETATLTISSPSAGITLGATTTQNITITDNDFANNPPTIVMDVASTSNYIDAGAATAPSSPFYVSGVISDPTDPASTLGINFTVNDVETAAGSLSVTAASSNQAVVANAGITITGSAATRNVKITPADVGYADITITVSDGVNNVTYVIKYAASAAAGTPSISNFFTGTSDASTAQAINDSLMFVGDDENQVLRLYNRNNSGLSIAGFDYTSSLGETDAGHPEVDIEASVKSGNRIYWMGSHGNSASGNNRPNRSRIFATDISGTGAATTLTYVGRYDNLKTDLINWDASNGHGLGANYLGLSASAATGVIPETADGSGFNIEALTLAPDGTTGYIGFRAPLEPAATRTKGLIVPITNFTSLVSGNPTTGPATFGTPILLDLGGRAIREIKRAPGGLYLIIAGPVAGATGVAPSDFRLYTWTGNASDAPGLRSADLTAVISGQGSFESIVDLPATLTPSTQIQLLEDNGDAVYYNDGTIAKELTQNNYKKFRSTTVTLGSVICGTVNAGTITGFNATCTGSSNLTLSNAVAGGVWASMYDTLATISNTGLVTAIRAGNDTITYTVTDANGCTGTAIFPLRINFRPQSTTNVTVCKSSLPYHWNGLTLNAAGTYTFTTTSAIGCDSLAKLILKVSDPVVTVTAPAILCYGSTTPVSVYATGGRAPYTGTGKIKEPAGTYTFTVTDDSGCVATKTITITQPGPVSVSVNAPDILCNGSTTTVTVTGTGGVTPLAYSLRGTAVQPGNVFTGVKAGNNIATVKDSNGCKYTTAFTVVQPTRIKVTLVKKTAITCKTATDGTIQVSASGGVGSYQYSIDGGAYSASASFAGLAAGLHTVTVKDANSCTGTLKVTISSSSKTCSSPTFSTAQGTEAPSSAMAAKQPASQLTVQVAPNPSESEFRLSVQSDSKADITIVVTNMFGQNVYQTKGSATGQYRFGSSFVPGMYIVRVLQGNEVKTLKLVKTKG